MSHFSLISFITFTHLLNVITCILDPSALKPMKSSVTEAPASGLFGLSLPSLPSFKLFSGTPCLSKSLQPGTCEAPTDCATNSGFDSGKSLCLEDKVCCVQSKKCGETALLNNTLLSNFNYPSHTREEGQCIYTVKILPLVEALRIEFVDVVLHQPDYKTGECSTDAFWVEGGAKEFTLGKLCGHLTGSHIYVPIDKKTLVKPVTLHVALSKDHFDRHWLIKVDQLKKTEIPPDHCLQYHTGETGVITSFNFNHDNKTEYGNIDGLKYAICVRQEDGFCKLEFESPFFRVASDYQSQMQANYPSRYPQDVAKAAKLKQYFYNIRNQPSKSYHRPVNGQYVNYPVSIEQHRPSLFCVNKDTLTFPPLDDGTEPVHCNNRFHPTKTLTTSSPPFVLMVNNKGTPHEKGFWLKYRQLVC